MTILTHTLNTNNIHSCINHSHILLKIHTHCNAMKFKSKYLHYYTPHKNSGWAGWSRAWFLCGARTVISGGCFCVDYRFILDLPRFFNCFQTYIFSVTLTSIGAKSSFSRLAVVKVVDQLELFNHSLH